MSVRKWMFAGALLLAAGLSSLGFAQKPGLKFNPDKKFKIVQFTDLHVKWQDPRSDIAFERMNQVLDDEKPDLVILREILSIASLRGKYAECIEDSLRP